jgi:hypothetical protein
MWSRKSDQSTPLADDSDFSLGGGVFNEKKFPAR